MDINFAEVAGYIVVCVVAWVVVKAIAFYLLGFSIGIIDPLRLRLRSLRIRDKLYMQFMYYSLWNGQLVIHGMSFLLPQKSDREGKEKKPISNRNPRSIPKWIQRLILRFLNLFKEFKIVLEKTEFKSIKVDLANITIIVKKNNLKASILIKDIYFGEKILLHGAVIDFSAVVNLEKSLRFENLILDVKLRNMKVSTLQFHSLRAIVNRKVSEETPSRVEEPTPEYCIEVIRTAIDKTRRALEPLERLSLAVDNITLYDIPYSTHPKLKTATDHLKYKISASSITLFASKLRVGSPGYKLLFAAEDAPINIKLTASSLMFSLHRTTCADVSQAEVFEFCEIPSVSFYGDTNIFSNGHLIENENQPFDTIIKFVGHISSPIVDFEISQLSFLKSFHENIKVFTTVLTNSDASAKPCSGFERSNEYIEGKQVVATYFQHVLPHVESKITVEDPMFLVSDEDELLVHKCSILSIQTRSEKFALGGQSKDRQLYYNLKNVVELMDYTFAYHHQKRRFKHRILTLDNVSLMSMSRILPNIKIGMDANIDSCNVDLSELTTLMALNKIIRKVNSKILLVEEEYFSSLYEKFANELESTVHECTKSQAQNKKSECDIHPKHFLFNKLPNFFDGIKLSLRSFSVIAGARSVFMSKDVFTKLTSQSPGDLVDGELRKLSYKIDRIRIQLIGRSESYDNYEQSSDLDNSTKVSSNKSFSYDEIGLEDSSSTLSSDSDHLWILSCVFEDMVTTLFSETRTRRQEMTPKTIFRLPSSTIRLYPICKQMNKSKDESEDKIFLSVQTGKTKTMFSLMTIFLVISAVHTFKETFTKDVNCHKSESKAKRHLFEFAKAKKKSPLSCIAKSDILDILDFEFSATHFDSVIVLPNGVKTRLELFASELSFKNIKELSLNGHYFRFCVECPTISNSWVRMITIVNFSILGDLISILDQLKNHEDNQENLRPSVTLSNEMWHFNIPHRFEMYQIFDNIPTMFKTIKQMVHSLKTSKNDTVIQPHVSKTPIVPKVRLTSKRWVFSVDDDPFESQLAMIFQVGLREQRSRLEKYEHFEQQFSKKLMGGKKEVKRTETFTENSDGKKRACNLPKVSSLLKRHSFSEVKSENDENKDGLETSADTENASKEMKEAEKLGIAFKTLQEQISKSWIRRIETIKVKEKVEFEKNFKFLWGNIDVTKFHADANKRILDFISSPALMNLIIEGIDIILGKPSCGIENIPGFIHDVGKGVPEDTKYSIMFPINLNANFLEIRCHLRDYPLPFVYMPNYLPGQPRSNEAAPISIQGDILLTEDMIRSNHEMRTIFVPLVPSCTLENDDPFYSLLIPRTLAPIKIYTNLNLGLNSNEDTMVTWGGSYSPALQQLMECFDNFSKPPVDPSPKLGFWDKIRNIFHARVSIKWNNDGQFHVVLKGSKNPYMIGGESAGFTVGLKGDITLGCNITGDPTKFLSFSSQQIFFGIPNLFAKPLFGWCRSSKNFLFFPSQEDTNLQKYAFYYYLLEMSDVKNLNKDIKVMRDNFFEKIAINLSGGIKLNVGFVFERMSSHKEERTLKSRPHWDVRMCNPLYVDDRSEFDSYRGFRSDFIHMSFDLLSNNRNSYNVMQLTPNAFKIFFKWWKSFSGNLPVRRGPLFGMNSMSPKFGVHLYTISYHADVAPLFICHMYHVLDPAEFTSRKKDQIEYVGLKAKTENFVMDLHQRKEVLHEYKQELDTTKKVTKLKFQEGDVSTFGIDIRTVQAQFKRRGLGDEKDVENYDIFDDDMTWYDPHDFDEFNFDSLENYVPSVKINPLLYSPKFVYRKQANYGDKYQVDVVTCKKIEPFRNSNYHECTLQPRVRSPLNLIDERIGVLRKEKDLAERELENSSITSGNEDFNATQMKLEKINAAISKVSELLQDLKSLENSDTSGEDIEEGYGKVVEHRDLNFSTIEWITKNNSFSKSFENRFYIFSMSLKWNEVVRDAVYKYIHLLDLNKEFSYITNHKAIKKIEDVIKGPRKTLFDTQSRSDEEDTEKHNVSSLKSDSVKGVDADDDVLAIFENDLRKFSGFSNYITHDNHVVQFVAPQIQLTTSKSPDSCTLLTSPSIKLKTVSFDANTTENQNNEDIFMNRYSLVLLKANVFVFHKDNFENYHDIFFDVNGYGQPNKDSWQPWLGIELCFDSKPLERDTLIKDFSGIFKFDRAFSFATLGDGNSEILQNRMVCQFPKTTISSNSRQYLALYDMIANLLVYVEPKSAHLKKEIERLLFRYDSSNLIHLQTLVTDLQRKIGAVSLVEKELAFRRHILDDAGIYDLDGIRKDKIESLIKLYILMKVMNAGSKEQAAEDQRLLLDIEANEIILHMLDDDGSAFLDIALAKSFFQRMQSSYGYNSNKLVIGIAQIFNLQKGVIFNDLMSPLRDSNKKTSSHNQPLIKVQWEIEKPIGGIKVIKNVETVLQGLAINVEQETITKLFAWAFPSEVENFIRQGSDGDSSEFDVESTTSDEVKNAYTDSNSFLSRGSFLEGDVSDTKSADDVDEMMKRSSDYMVINKMVINSFVLSVSYRGHGAKRLINVTDFVFVFPKLVFQHETMTKVDLTMVLKRVLLKSLLKHAGKFIGNKLKKHSVEGNKSNSTLKQLTDYKSFTDLEELKK